jgi:serine/threonine-protein kinase
VAVLPFTNLSGQPENDFLAVGLAEETAMRLARVPGFRVAASSTARRFRAGADAPATIGAALNATWLVTGSVQRNADRLRVRIELVRAGDGALIWGGGFETATNDVLAIEDSAAQALALAIAPRLDRRQTSRLAAGPTGNPQAYVHYLRGKYLLSQRNPTAVARAIDEFEQAAALDSAFAEALTQAGFGFALFIDWEWAYEGVSRDSLFTLATAAARQALARDSLSADAWWLLGFLGMHRDSSSFVAARNALRRAVALNPRHAQALHSLGVLEARLGNDSSARAMMDRALEAEPGQAISLFVLSEISYRAQAFDEARRWLDSTLAVEPGFFFAYAFRALARLQSGDTAGARRDAETAIRYSAGDPVPGTAALVIIEARRGDLRAARALHGRLEDEVILRGEAARTTATLWLAMADVAVGRGQEAIRRLERVTERSAEFWFWLQLPEFDPVRREPRFMQLAEAARPAEAPR